MFINFWYPTVLSSDLTTEPKKVRMLGQDFVVFRDSEGKAHCLSDICVHRGASLSGGKIKDDCVECPYHGWRFNGEGRCTRIPSLGLDAKIPARARVDAYPVQEKYGLVFAFLGDLPEEERPPIMEIPEYGQDGWRATWQHFVWAIDYKRSIENGIDPAHNEFVHPTHGFKGERDDYKLNPITLTETEWGTGFYGEREAPPLPDEKMRAVSGRTENAIIRGGTGHEGISSVWTHINPTDKIHIHQYLYETPIDEGHTSIFLINLRNFLTDPSEDERMMGRNEYVALQDRDVLEPLKPVLTPRTNVHEVFVEHDRAVARYRERVKEWEARGWRIDIDAVNRTRHKVAYAIPCPARRQVKGWVLDAVPLLPAAAAQQAAAE